MGKDEDVKAPDSVKHSSQSPIPFDPGIVPAITGLELHKTEITKRSNTYTGYGHTREEADKNAGEKYSRGEKDRK